MTDFLPQNSQGPIAGWSSRRADRAVFCSGFQCRLAILLATLAISVTGCATLDPARVQLVAEPVTQGCGASDGEVLVRMTVRNANRRTLQVWIEPSSHQPPYTLSWLGYQILDDNDATDWKHGPGGHGPMPPSTLSIGPGDTAELLVGLYGLTPGDHAKNFKIQFKDAAGHVFVTSPFKACRSA